MENQTDLDLNRPSSLSEQQWLQRVLSRIASTLERDDLVQRITVQLRQSLQADRVVLYYFYRQWKGQVVCEALSADELSILGSTGADDCFNAEYAALYEAGRYRAIANIEQEAIHECHRDFLRTMQVKANLAVPILVPKGLWGLLVAHYCQTSHAWSTAEIEQVRSGAELLASTSCISEG
ncbi:MAG: GAF domain-containing protein [Thermosynechococcaceae cyanobacterium MS004]|nr:GAF domain-containing protein [Thermosynechococcaceae cyanobacterium MS004]